MKQNEPNEKKKKNDVPETGNGSGYLHALLPRPTLYIIISQ